MSGCSVQRCGRIAWPRGTAFDVHDTTAPPSTAADALSGWPSNSDASWISSASVIGCEPACATRPLAAARPPTTAAADEPSPRECGMSLRQRTFRPAARHPAARRPRSIARTTRCSESSGTWPAPSPSTSTVRPESVVSTMISSYRLSARPRLSKPGPRLALDAATTAGQPSGRQAESASPTVTPRPSSCDDGAGVDRNGRHRAACPSARCRDPSVRCR